MIATVGQQVNLKALPLPGAQFVTWSGACETSDPQCEITVDTDTTAHAVFEPTHYELKVSVMGDGAVRVTTPDQTMDCDSNCVVGVRNGALATIVGIAESESTFDGFAGAGCTGLNPCVVSMNQSLAIDARFSPELVRLELLVEGPGSIALMGDDFECNERCTVERRRGTRVRLRPIANSTAAFAGWGIDCDGEVPFCELDLQQDRVIQARFTSVPKLALGANQTCVLEGGIVRCWGYFVAAGTDRSYGRQPGQMPAPRLPVTHPFAAFRVADIALGYGHGCALLTNGGVRCWGTNTQGELGRGNRESVGASFPSTMPPRSVNVGAPAMRLTAGIDSSCTLISGREVRCWGSGAGREGGTQVNAPVGDEDGEMPPSGIVLEHAIVAMDGGGGHICILLDGGQVRCWGSAEYGETPQAGSSADVELDGVAVGIATGWHHSCALMGSGEVYCWGLNSFGMLGQGNLLDRRADSKVQGPARVPLPFAAIAISAFGSHTCAVLEGGVLACWGDNEYGQLGLGHTEIIGDGPDEMQSIIVDLPGPVQSVATGLGHTCALLRDKSLYCWGRNDDGQLGLGHTDGVGHNEISPVGAVPTTYR